tara:strand:+ start:245 stop:406 length:162 start_codon:yes stop_codon:yes gene_type:complete
MSEEELNSIYKTKFNNLFKVKKSCIKNLDKLNEKKVNEIYKLKFEDLKDYLLK